MTAIFISDPLINLGGIGGTVFDGLIRLTPGPGLAIDFGDCSTCCGSRGMSVVLEIRDGLIEHIYQQSGKTYKELPQPLELLAQDPFYYSIEFLPFTSLEKSRCNCCFNPVGELRIPNGADAIEFTELLANLRHPGDTAKDIARLRAELVAVQVQYDRLLADFELLNERVNPINSADFFDTEDSISSAIAEVLGCG